MNPNDQAFVDLCTELRKLGATSVTSEGRTATFTTTLPRHLTEARISLPDDLERFPGRK